MEQWADDGSALEGKQQTRKPIFAFCSNLYYVMLARLHIFVIHEFGAFSEIIFLWKSFGAKQNKKESCTHTQIVNGEDGEKSDRRKWQIVSTARVWMGLYHAALKLFSHSRNVEKQQVERTAIEEGKEITSPVQG